MVAAANSVQTAGESWSPWRAARRRLFARRLVAAAMIFVALLVLVCVLAPAFSPYDPNQQDLELKASPPSSAHWMGTDPLGRDIATRILYGGRISLLVGVLATAVAAVIGISYGLIAGLARPRVDAVMMRIVDILYAFPFITFVIILTVVFSEHRWMKALDGWLDRNEIQLEPSIIFIFIAIGAIEWLTMARVVRGQVLALKNQEFILAARAYGARVPHILFCHLLPNVLGPVIIYASLTVPGVMLLEATLSFLGLGIQPPDASWGVLIRDGADNMETSPWMLFFPGLFFSSTLLAMNFIGDGLRDALDPKSLA